MTNDTPRESQREQDGIVGGDEPIPSASDDKVLEETVRLAREGQRERESDPKERGTNADD